MCESLHTFRTGGVAVTFIDPHSPNDHDSYSESSSSFLTERRFSSPLSELSAGKPRAVNMPTSMRDGSPTVAIASVFSVTLPVTRDSDVNASQPVKFGASEISRSPSINSSA